MLRLQLNSHHHITPRTWDGGAGGAIPWHQRRREESSSRGGREGPGGHVELSEVEAGHVTGPGAAHAGEELAGGARRGLEHVVSQVLGVTQVLPHICPVTVTSIIQWSLNITWSINISYDIISLEAS